MKDKILEWYISGHYLPTEMAIGSVVFMSALFGIFGGVAISESV